jgi:hypothetical protein
MRWQPKAKTCQYSHQVVFNEEDKPMAIDGMSLQRD